MQITLNIDNQAALERLLRFMHHDLQDTAQVVAVQPNNTWAVSDIPQAAPFDMPDLDALIERGTKVWAGTSADDFVQGLRQEGSF
jgi:hypothetical protein